MNTFTYTTEVNKLDGKRTDVTLCRSGMYKAKYTIRTKALEKLLMNGPFTYRTFMDAYYDSIPLIPAENL